MENKEEDNLFECSTVGTVQSQCQTTTTTTTTTTRSTRSVSQTTFRKSSNSLTNVLQSTHETETANHSETDSNSTTTIKTTTTTTNNKQIIYTTKHVLSISETKENTQFRKAFNRRAFGYVYNTDDTNENCTVPKAQERSSQMSREQYQQIIDLLKNWVQDDKEKEKAFRTQHHIGYRVAAKFLLGSLNLPDGTSKVELRRRCKEGAGKLVVPTEDIFDAIADAHVKQLAHLKANPTHKMVQHRYHNITLAQCRDFVRLCPSCLKDHPTTTPLKGAEQPILSERFRDRFQVDLIDMTTRPATNVYNLVMRWIVTVKDHFTGLVALSAVPRKRPKFVAHELSSLFGVIGFPFIFHTDNGKEFTANAIVQSLKQLCPAVTTVTGRPRKPSDQGSVENMNKLVKNLLNRLEEEDRQRKVVPN
jgi:hypothetical protein